jgi:site-specific DNA recombinase
MSRRAAIYVRISVAQEASVSIERQIEAAQQYAAARGWLVVATFTDEGVSATHNKPDDRAGWRALLDSSETFDAVIIWKLDRLARRVIDFHLANEALKKRGAALVAVENAIDMTTPDGRMIAGVLANFAEYEAEAIAARVRAARTHLLHAGRVVGGSLPYGWRSVSNPDGPGYVLVQDPERVGYVRGMVDRTLASSSIYSTVQWLDEVGAPLPGSSQKNRKAGGWSYSTVERILRHPVLAGMTPFNPGNRTKARGLDVRRDRDGLPVVDESVAIMPLGEWRAMVKALDERDTAQSKPVALRAKTSALLSGLLYCGEHLDDDGTGTRMHRGTVQGRQGYYCPTCYMALSNFEGVLVDEFLRQKGEHVRWSVVEEVHEGGAALLPEIEHRMAELTDLLRVTDDEAQADGYSEQLARLRTLRREARAKAPNVVLRPVRGTQDFGHDWAGAETVEDKRDVLGDAVERIWVVRGRPGRRTNAQLLARLVFDWKMPDQLGPIEVPDDATLAAWAV